jgi:hypothetical protein
MPIPMSGERKRELVNSKNVTLNGRPATISGLLCDFAIVSQFPTGLQAEFAWQTVERIINNGGNFRA